MGMEQRTVSLTLREANLEERKITGYAAVFNENYTQLKDRWGDSFYEKVSPGAFIKTLADKTRDKFMLINHDWNKVVGRTNSNLVLEEDEKGLRFELTVPNTTDGNDLLENVRNGLIQGCSFGFNILDQTTRWDDSWNFYRDITEVDLFEVTATPIPAYADTELSARSDLSLRDIKPEEEKQVEKPIERNEEKNIKTRSVDIISAFFDGFNKI